MSLDHIIVLIFLAGTLLVGYISGRKIKTFKDFAISHKGYSMPVLMATIFATVIGGGSIFGLIEKVYTGGLVFVLVFSGMALNRILIANYIIPKFSDAQLSYPSLGDLMHDVYGKQGQILFGICSVLVSVASVGTQVYSEVLPKN